MKFEEFAMLLLGMLLFSFLEYAWWIFPALLFLPDVSMIGYSVNKRFGAILYNLVHHKATGIIIYLLGATADITPLMLAGIILFSHSSFDRMLGYGLKYPDSFHHTHLGWIGNKQKTDISE